MIARYCKVFVQEVARPHTPRPCRCAKQAGDGRAGRGIGAATGQPARNTGRRNSIDRERSAQSAKF